MRTAGLASLFVFAFLAATGLISPGARAQEAPPDTPAPKISAPDLTPDPHGALSQQQMMDLFRVVADRDIQNQKRLRDYTYVERDETHDLDGSGKVTKTESETFEIMEIYGRQVRRKIAKDDKPLSEKEAAKEEEKIQKAMDERKNESEGEREKREKKQRKQEDEDRKWVREIADAYNFRLVGTEQIDGRDNWVIEGEPRPGFHPEMRFANYMPDFHGRVWIDKQDLQLSKMDIECIQNLSWGLVVARVHKGTRVVLEQTRINDEVWLPKHQAVKLSARVGLFKSLHLDEDDTFRDYKKFRATARVVGAVPVSK